MLERPPWLKVKIEHYSDLVARGEDREDYPVPTVCSESACPNVFDCASRGEVSFLILGTTCTRACAYCRVGRGAPAPPDATEPLRLAEIVAKRQLKSVVITSVTRDDIEDGGASAFGATVAAVRETSPGCFIELLVPDFGGNWGALETIVKAGADVVGHNIETVARLYPLVRPQADYRLSLMLLKRLAAAGQQVKSGLMVGLGETRAEVRRTLDDLAAAGVRSVTIGQYLAPTPGHLQVDRYWRPPEFMGIAKYALRIGYKRVLSGPLVRSSYRSARWKNAAERASARS